MSRKMVDYVFRQLRYSAVDPTASTGANSEWVRENYLSKGYEVIGQEVVRAEANDVYVGLHFAKYEELGDVVVPEEVARRVGRPRKEVEPA